MFYLRPHNLNLQCVLGTNGDREMIASLMMANFDVFDVTMSDLQNKKITLDAFQGLVFPGGFSYAGKLQNVYYITIHKNR